MSELFPQRAGKPSARDIVSAELDFVMTDNRRRDLDNMASSVLDLLQDAGIIADDCWREIPELVLRGFRADAGEEACCVIRIHCGA
jgi:Holliday junction resolvase RusA-like endonuclease